MQGKQQIMQQLMGGGGGGMSIGGFAGGQLPIGRGNLSQEELMKLIQMMQGGGGMGAPVGTPQPPGGVMGPASSQVMANRRF